MSRIFCRKLFAIGVILFCYEFSNAHDLNSNSIESENTMPLLQNQTLVDSGFFASVQKGIRIASNLSLDNVSEMATMILFSDDKNLGAISKNVGNYLNRLDTKRRELNNIKINRNTKIIIKRDK